MNSWKEAVDIEALAKWMDHQGLESGPIYDIIELTGGTQNILLRFKRGRRTFVLRRPPNHPRMDSSKTIERESRMLEALTDTQVPHAQLIAACNDRTVLGASFYLMEPIEGFNANGPLPEPHASSLAMRRQMGFSLVDALLTLGSVDYKAAGVADLGKLENFLERQVPRWQSQLAGYADYEGWPGTNSLKSIDAIANWLEENRPVTFTPGIMHGDFHLANVMYNPNGPEVAAIVDWELTTIGDPLIDLGWLMATWPDSEQHRPGDIAATPWQGFPTRAELLDHYAKYTERDMSAIDWYGVFACYKMAILLEGTYARSCAGKASKETGQRLHKSALGLIDKALRWIN